MLAALRAFIPSVADVVRSDASAFVARIATNAIERRASEAICAALPPNQATQAPADLYTLEPLEPMEPDGAAIDGAANGQERADHPTCEERFSFPKVGWDLGLAGHDEAVLEYYDRVLDTGQFERQLCPRALADLTAITRELQSKIPEIVARNTSSGVAIAGMIARAKANGTPQAKAVAAALQVMLLSTIQREAEPSRGMFSFIVGPTQRSAEDLRNLEVAYRTMLPRTHKPTDLVARARASMWDAIVANKPIDMARFGASHSYVPIAGLRSSTTLFRPNSNGTQKSEEIMETLGRWGIIASIENIAELARTRAVAAHPATIGRAMSAHNAASGLYVTEQHTGYERRGLGYPLVVAHGTLAALRSLSDSAYAHATTCLFLYVRDLVFLGERIPDAASDAVIYSAIAKIPQAPLPDTPAPYTLPRVPLACRAPPAGHNARTRRVIRETCALNAGLVQKSLALQRVRQSLGTDEAAGRLTLEQMLALHEDLDAVALLTQEEQRAVLDRAEGAIDRVRTRVQTQARRAGANNDAAESARFVTDARRVVVLERKMLAQIRVRGRTRIMEVNPTGPYDPYEGVYAHIERCALSDTPHALKEAELGVLHAEYDVAGRIAFRQPILQLPSTSSVQKAIKWVVGELTPTCVSDLAGNAAETGVVRVRFVQYKATEPPGVGYALYALLPILDHVSASCNGQSEATQREYAPLRSATLRAIQRLLQRA